MVDEPLQPHHFIHHALVGEAKELAHSGPFCLGVVKVGNSGEDDAARVRAALLLRLARNDRVALPRRCRFNQVAPGAAV